MGPVSDATVKVHTLQTFRDRVLATHYYVGDRWPSDADWRMAVRRARNWQEMASVVAHLPALAAIAASAGHCQSAQTPGL